MKFLTAPDPAYDSSSGHLPEGEPVVPNFPVSQLNTFLGVYTFGTCVGAVAKDIEDDPDEMAEGLKKQFPGLPGITLETYVLETAKAAAGMDEGERTNVMITADSARLGTGNHGIVTLWEEQPLGD